MTNLTNEEQNELRQLMEAVPFRGNYTDLGQQEEIRRDFLIEVARRRTEARGESDG